MLSATGPGEAPIGYLMCDVASHVSAQLAARDRAGLVCDSTGWSPNPNTNANISGCSAYIGRYEPSASTGAVTHILQPTLSLADAGKRL